MRVLAVMGVVAVAAYLAGHWRPSRALLVRLDRIASLDERVSALERQAPGHDPQGDVEKLFILQHYEALARELAAERQAPDLAGRLAAVERMGPATSAGGIARTNGSKAGGRRDA